MENNLLISVIIPVFNAEAYLEQCIDSVISQTYQNLEIILVDDGSPDSCGVICDRYAQKDDRVRVIHRVNQGVSAARNAGLDICTGDVIAFVDSDDWIEPEMYESMLRMMLEKDLDVVFCGTDRIKDGKVQDKLARYYEDGAVVEAQEVMAQCLQTKILAHCWNRLCRRHCLEKVRFPVGKTYEDVRVTHLPFVYACRPVGFLHAPLYNYRHTQNGITGTANVREAFFIFQARQDLLQYAKEHVPELEDACMGRVVDIAISACNVQLRHPDLDITADVDEIRAYFRDNFGKILRNRALPLDRKLLVIMYLYCRSAYVWLFRLLKKS